MRILGQDIKGRTLASKLVSTFPVKPVLTFSNKLSSILLFRLDVVIATRLQQKGLRDSIGVTDFLCIMTLV
jgi:hypothetical protein